MHDFLKLKDAKPYKNNKKSRIITDQKSAYRYLFASDPWHEKTHDGTDTTKIRQHARDSKIKQARK
jgi:hypothetical protein